MSKRSLMFGAALGAAVMIVWGSVAQPVAAGRREGKGRAPKEGKHKAWKGGDEAGPRKMDKWGNVPERGRAKQAQAMSQGMLERLGDQCPEVREEIKRYMEALRPVLEKTRDLRERVHKAVREAHQNGEIHSLEDLQRVAAPFREEATELAEALIDAKIEHSEKILPILKAKRGEIVPLVARLLVLPPRPRRRRGAWNAEDKEGLRDMAPEERHKMFREKKRFRRENPDKEGPREKPGKKGKKHGEALDW